MRRALAVAALSAAAFTMTTDVLCAPPSTTEVISFEKEPTGPVYYVYSDSGQGPFAIDGYDSYGNGKAVIASMQGKNNVLTVPNVPGCGCSYLWIDLSACEGHAVNLHSFKIIGTTQPAKVLYLDFGGNAWPSVSGVMIPPTGASGYTTVTPSGPWAGAVARLLVYFDHGGAIDDIKYSCPDDPCMPPPPPTADADDWFTGGGFMFDTPSGVKATYGVGGGFKNGAFWGHLNYIDHATGMHFHGTSVTAYSVIGPTSRHTEGTCKLGQAEGYTYKLDIADNGEPGTADKLRIEVRDSAGNLVYAADGFSGTRVVDGGNLQLHKGGTGSTGGKGGGKKSGKKKKHK
jgi:hypothetical protein